MKFETENGQTTFQFTVGELAQHHWSGNKLFRTEDGFEWRQGGADEAVATVEEIFGEKEIEFAEEYLLLHFNDDVTWFYEQDLPSLEWG